ncbi:non-ribosomal peptide synthetase [Vibrio alginolyticus]|uniref:Amino acid adenylation domain-containing protein n=1 Tax=Vibrio alginolyticus TaxID=663 RepID=A0A7Y4B6Q3_VIBAL|nr:non-ribosomal peptide synthetase [Vibrio alginolyticus]NOI11645.1 amino acid adenylation domain-containing protein [Vibrio alginolyticus]
MSVQAILSSLEQQGVKLWLEGEALKFYSPSKLDQATADLIRADREAIVAHLQKLKEWPVIHTAPSTFGQQRHWLLSMDADVADSYNIPLLLSIKESISVTKITEGLTALVRQQEGLRTTFAVDGNQLVQQIRVPFIVSVIHKDGLTEEAFSAYCQHCLEEEWEEESPLFNAHYLEKCNGQRFLYVCFHHAIADAWSLNVFVEQLYGFICGQKPAVLDCQSREIAAIQHRWINSSEADKQRDYWQDLLSQEYQPLRLPVDTTIPPEAECNTSTIPLILSGSMPVERLHELCRQEGVTPFMYCFSAFALLMHKLTGQNAMVIGVPIAERDKTNRNLIGCMLNTLPVLVDFKGIITIKDLLAHIKDRILGAFRHRNLPIEEMMALTRKGRIAAASTLYQVLFNMMNFSHKESEAAHTVFSYEDSGRVASPYPLSFDIWMSGNTLQGRCIFDGRSFTVDRVKKLADYYGELLAILSNGDTPLSSISLLSEQEVSECWRRVKAVTDERVTDTLIDAFDRQVQCEPNRLAVQDQGGEISYRELWQRASKLALLLIEQGVRENDVVGIHLPRGQQAIIAIMAVLKAKAGYLPLGYDYPAERISIMIEDACPKVIITEGLLQSPNTLSAFSGSLVTLSEAVWQGELSDSERSILSGYSSDQLIYLTYTSGSTGRPKGIALTNRSLMNLIDWSTEHHLTPARVMQFASLNFDASFHEIFYALCSGGSVHVVDDNTRLDPDELVQFVAKNGLSYVIWPVTVLKQVATHYCDAPGILQTLKEVITTGEQLILNESIKTLFSNLPTCRLSNHYGPAETHVVTSYHYQGDPSTWENYCPVGREICNTEILVLDAHQKPVPDGVQGEAYIAGVSLALGYVNDEEKTKQKFTEISLAPEQFARVYRTGDIVKRRADGNLVFIERADTMVKINGVRVELAEIEICLLRHPHIHEAVVRAYETTLGKALCCYLVTSQNITGDIPSLKHHLTKYLPNSVIPSEFVFLDRIPLNKNGKVDIGVLNEWRQRKAQGDEVIPSDSSPISQKVHDIYRTQLGMESFDNTKSFFELNGNSLLAGLITARLRREFKVDLSIKDFFLNSSVQAMSTFIENLNATPTETQKAVQTLDRYSLPVFEFSTPLKNQKTIAFRIAQKGSLEAVSLALSSVIESHDVFESRLSNGQVVRSFGVKPAVERHVVDSDSQLNALINVANETTLEHDSDGQITARFWLIEVNRECVVCMTWHVLLMDAHSVYEFKRALSHQLAGGAVSSQPPSYWDWLARAHHDTSLESTPEWVRTLEEYERPWAWNEAKHCAISRFTLDDQTVRALRAVCIDEQCSLPSIFLQTFGHMVCEVGEVDICQVGVPVTLRKDELTGPPIGCLTDILPLLISKDGKESYMELFHRLLQLIDEAPPMVNLSATRSGHNLTVPSGCHVLFNYLTESAICAPFDGIDVPPRWPRYDAVLECIEDGECIILELHIPAMPEASQQKLLMLLVNQLRLTGVTQL